MRHHSVLMVAERINSVPGFRTSATFFTFLRSNLVLPPSDLNSTTSTPLLDASPSHLLPPLLPSSLATMSLVDSPAEIPNPTASSPLDDIPPLTTQILKNEDDKIAALKLVADSIAQQRQFAARAVILHPLTIVAWIGLLAILAQFLLKTSKDIGLLFTTSAGATMACLVGVRALTSGYLALAEGLTWDFVRNDEGEEDLILGSRYGDELIGALVLRLEKSGGGGKRKSGKNGKGGNGVVRAWTVRNRYRGKGVGTELLEEAVRVTREKLGRDAGVGFAAEHANSKMVLPDLFNVGFRRRETQAGRMLEGVVAGMEKRKR